MEMVQKEDWTLSPLPSSAYLQRGKQGPIWSPSEIVLIWDLRPHKRECCPNPTDRRTLGSSPGCVVTWRGHFSLDLSLPCL